MIPDKTNRNVCWKLDKCLYYNITYITNYNLMCVHCFVGGSPLQVRIDQTRIEVEEGQSARFVCSVASGFNEVCKYSYWGRLF